MEECLSLCGRSHRLKKFTLEQCDMILMGWVGRTLVYTAFWGGGLRKYKTGAFFCYKNGTPLALCIFDKSSAMAYTWIFL